MGRGAAAEGGKAAPEKEFMYGTLSRFKLRHTRGGKAALRPLTKISRISIIKRFLGSIIVLFCTPKKHITDLTFVFLTAFPVVTASPAFVHEAAASLASASSSSPSRKNVFVVTGHKIATAEQFFSRYQQAVPIFKMRRGLRRAVLLQNGQGLGGLLFY